MSEGKEEFERVPTAQPEQTLGALGGVASTGVTLVLPFLLWVNVTLPSAGTLCTSCTQSGKERGEDR